MLRFPLSQAAWRFRDVTNRTAWRDAVVPGCVHRDLLRNGMIPDPFWGTNETDLHWIEEHDWEYRAEFEVPETLRGQKTIELVADGLDTVATVTLNGREIARTENMFAGYRWDVTKRLRRGRNVIAIRFDSAMRYIRKHRTAHQPREFNDPVGGCTRIRKQQCQFGWDWGPRFVTAGIWRDLWLEAHDGNRLSSVRVVQEHGADGHVVLYLSPELVRPEKGATCHWRLILNHIVVAEGTGTTIAIEHPQLWWPHGQGEQPLYALQVEMRAANGRTLGHWSRRIGLRTIVLDRRKDEWGQSFQFVVNGRAVFAKGANWIPVHSFVAGLTRADYERDLRAAAQAHMNMIRVWGGGIYESEDFYDVCDELGLLVWQDFMFGCTLYPADRAFLESVQIEAEHQIIRLRHRACLALWCGNNEVWGCNPHTLLEPSAAGKRTRADYEKLFHGVLPAACAAHDPVTAYWPSSPWSGDEKHDFAVNEQRGDTHFWAVWHGRAPVKDYEKYAFRFVSEFGMQSYCSPETQATFCPPDDTNIFGLSMENHQKNRGGNQVILDYVSRRYRFPKSQEALIYLSQLNQAHCMQTGVEHYRRSMPRCMGALYWQLNDCWPVASWSSIEFSGRWRALHHLARRFFAPLLASAHVPGDELPVIGNYRSSTVNEVDLYTVCDAPTATKGVLRWDIFHLDGRVLESGTRKVALRPQESVKHRRVDLRRVLKKFDRDHIYLRIALDAVLPNGTNGSSAAHAPKPMTRVSEETVFLTAPRFLQLPKGTPKIAVRVSAQRRAEIDFTSSVFQHRFTFDLPDFAHHASDNFFELYPGETKTVVVELDQPATPSELKENLVWRSLADTW